MKSYIEIRLNKKAQGCALPEGLGVSINNDRKIYLINPKFQYKLSFYVALIVLMTGLIYPFTIYSLLDSIIANFSLKNPEIAQYYIEKRVVLLSLLILVHLGLVAMTFLSCIFLSHKIAGPLYKLQKHLRDVGTGKFSNKLEFRRGDYFQEIADDLNTAIEQIEDQYKNDLVYLSEINSYITSLSGVVPENEKKILGDISEKLLEIQARFTNKE